MNLSTLPQAVFCESRLHHPSAAFHGTTLRAQHGPAEPSRAANHLAGHPHPGFEAPSAHGFPTLGYVSAAVGARGTEWNRTRSAWWFQVNP